MRVLSRCCFANTKGMWEVENDFRIQNTKFVTNDSKATVSVPFLIYSLR